MHIPAHFNENDPLALRRLIDENNFGTLISVIDERPYATHLPFIYAPWRNRLLGHMARSNPHWHALADSSAEALVVFQGPHSYVSPTWYAEPGVPTWNYAAVHLYGRFRVIDDPAEHQQVMESLTDHHEAERPNPWQADFDSSMVSRMIGATVAFDIVISETQGKFKLNQNRSVKDRENVIRELHAQGSDTAVGLAELMRQRL